MLYMLIAVLILIDQAVKYFVVASMYLGQSISVLPSVRLTYLTNTGMAFSLFQNANTFFIVLTILALGGISFWLYTGRTSLPRMLRTALALVFAGACGNLLDRMFRGAVVDFIDIGVRNWRWPAFNVADACITAGGVLLFIMLIKDTRDVSHSR